jgi:AcrR family transcriptional regulator
MNQTATAQITATAGTADTLIEAARRLFAQHGYEGTSVRAITTEAGANLGAITYHFGSKRELYDRVVGSVVAPLAERVEAVVRAGGSVLDRVEAVVRTYFAYLAENPDMPRLMMQELVLGGLPSAAVGGPLSRVHGALHGLVREGQTRGEVRGGAAALLAVFIISVPVHLALVQAPLRAFIGIDLQRGELRERAIDHATRFVRAGLSATAEKSR